MKSQYTEPYKKMFYERLAEGKKPVSVSGFIMRETSGNASKWRSRYTKSLCNSLRKDGWVQCLSIKGGKAFEPPKVNAT